MQRLCALVCSALLVATINECEGKVPPSNSGCPLWNPSVNCFAPNPVECSSRAPCPNKGAVCCPYECGGARCVKQADLCPAVNNNVRCLVAGKRNCEGSYDCSGGYCCTDVTCGGSSCVARPGTCPATNPMIKCAQPAPSCQRDSDCTTATQKCCLTNCEGMKCVDPVGVCPPIQPGEVGVCSIQCSAKTPCPAGQVCCKTACGGFICK